jgi:hypothetical protein
MTEDPRVAHVEPGLGNNEAEMYAALWALAPFPRLPDDAPAEIKDLAIDIHEPKRVYAVYKAARRHQFQVLVERYAETFFDILLNLRADLGQVHLSNPIRVSISLLPYSDMLLLPKAACRWCASTKIQCHKCPNPRNSPCLPGQCGATLMHES